MKFGEPGETRTHGPRIKSALRYQLRHRLKWCGRWESNPHGIATEGFSYHTMLP